MRTESTKSVLGGILLCTWVVCVAGTAVAARPEQRARSNASKVGDVMETPSSAKSNTVKLNKTVVLAKNTGTKAGSATSVTNTKPQSTKEKKTVGRYWKRLMNMVREINHAHRTTKK